MSLTFRTYQPDDFSVLEMMILSLYEEGTMGEPMTPVKIRRTVLPRTPSSASNSKSRPTMSELWPSTGGSASIFPKITTFSHLRTEAKSLDKFQGSILSSSTMSHCHIVTLRDCSELT